MNNFCEAEQPVDGKAATEVGAFEDVAQAAESESKETYVNNNLISLLKKAIGSRSIIEFTNQCGLSISFVSRLLNNNLPSRPSKRSFLKMAPNLGNGVTLSQLLTAAGYEEDFNFDYPKEAENETKLDFSMRSPSYITAPTYAMSLLVNVLVQSKQLTMPIDISVQPGLFEVKSKIDGKCLVGLPALCQKDADKINLMSQTLKRSFIMALDIYSEQLKNVCFVMITNQESIFEDFGSNLNAMDDIELYNVFTEDCYSFCREKQVCSSFSSDSLIKPKYEFLKTE